MLANSKKQGAGRPAKTLQQLGVRQDDATYVNAGCRGLLKRSWDQQESERAGCNMDRGEIEMGARWRWPWS